MLSLVKATVTFISLFNMIPRLARNDNSISSLTHFVMLSTAEASLCTFINVSELFFGKGNACIAILVGVAMGLQMFRPYGAGDGVRCT